MSLTLTDLASWRIDKIAVVGPGIVGMPMAATLAQAHIREGTERPAPVLVVQRNSTTSGWKVGAINAGRSPIGGIEPDLDRIVRAAVAEGLLTASHDYGKVADADVILICVQTDKKGFAPDYGPLLECLSDIGEALRKRPAGNIPLLVIESTLAPSSMTTVVRQRFASHGLVEGRDLLLGNSPNRVMPGRLVERVTTCDKIVAGLHPATPGLIERLYCRIVTAGTLLPTNSLTAEVVKTLENAYRDLRIAYATEIVRYCDQHDIDFYQVRQQVNQRLAQTDAASDDPNAVPRGGLLIPTIGVGGHCLPKDGVLLWWRKLESGADSSRSLILEARQINDQSPAETIRLAERQFGSIAGRSIALLGAAYRFNSEDTRNSPTFSLARLLLERGCRLTIHDPYVEPEDQNLVRFGLAKYFTRDLGEAVADSEYLIACTGHRVYLECRAAMLRAAPRLKGLLDGCNLYHRDGITTAGVSYTGIGRGRKPPDGGFVDFVYHGFRAVETGLANEARDLATFLNERYAEAPFDRIEFETMQRIAGTCVTGCVITDPGVVPKVPPWDGFSSRLADLAS